MARIIATVAATLAGSVGVYSGLAYASYSSVEQEYKGHLSVVEQKQKEQQALESSITDTERRIEGLRKKSEDSEQTASELEGRITDAEAQLTTLKRLRQTAVQQVKEQQEAMEAARTSVLGFKGDIEQMKSAMQDAQKSAAASQKVAEARRKQINPLNHPLVQQYFQQK